MPSTIGNAMPMTFPPTTRAGVATRLALASPQDIAAVLVAAGLRPVSEDDAILLASQLCRTLWWRSHSPLRHMTRPSTLDALVDRIARRLGQALPTGDAWARLDALTAQLLPGGRVATLDQLSPDTRSRLRKKLWPAWIGVAAGTSAAGTRYAALKLLGWTRGPLWDLAPLLPKLGPALVGLRTGILTVARVCGPAGIVLALLSLDQALGADDERALPLLLGLGLLSRELSEAHRHKREPTPGQ